MSVSRYDPDGIVVWARSIGGRNNAAIVSGGQSIGIAADRQGNTFVTTTFNVPASFSEITLTNRSADDVFLARLSASGELSWVRQISGGVCNQEHAVATDAQGNAYVVAPFQTQANFGSDAPPLIADVGLFMAKYDHAGAILWSTAIQGTNSARGVCLDPEGNIYIAGTFRGKGVFGATVLEERGGSDAYVVKLNAAGLVAWTRQFGGHGLDAGLGIASDHRGNLSFVGSFSSTFYFRDQSLTSNGMTDLFAVRISSDAPPRPTLGFTLDAGSVRVWWPSGFTGFAIETAASPAALDWEPSMVSVIEMGGRFQATFEPQEAAHFFRLRKP